MMTRRDANWLMLRAASAAGGLEFFQSWVKATQIPAMPASHAHERNSAAPPEPVRSNGYQPQFFSPDAFAILDTFTAILIPTDETPGAREAHVAEFIDFVVNAAAEYAPQTQQQWRTALDYLQTQKFGRLSLEDQLSFIKQISEPERDSSKRHPGLPTYRLIKEMTLQAFYTSRVGLIDVLEYRGMAYLTEFPACNHPEHHKV